MEDFHLRVNTTAQIKPHVYMLRTIKNDSIRFADEATQYQTKFFSI